MRAWAQDLESMAKPLCQQLLGALSQVLRDEQALEALEESVSSRRRGGGWGPGLPWPAGSPAPCAHSWSRA